MTKGTFPQSITRETLGWSPACQCESDVQPCVVLDPFAGSGTVGLVC